MMNDLNDKVNEITSKIHHISSLRLFTKNRIKNLNTETIILENDLDVCNQSNALLDRISEEEIENGIKTYIYLLEQGLKAIFPEQEVGLNAEISKIRGKVSLKIKTTFKGLDGVLVEGDGLDSFGGAVSTVQSLLLRISLILKRDLKPFLILDESFPAVDGDRVGLLVDFLKVLCEKLNMDILCITHNNLISEKADLAYQIYPTKDGAKLKKI